MADEEMRELERRAAAGEDVHAALARARCRAGQCCAHETGGYGGAGVFIDEVRTYRGHLIQQTSAAVSINVTGNAQEVAEALRDIAARLKLQLPSPYKDSQAARTTRMRLRRAVEELRDGLDEAASP